MLLNGKSEELQKYSKLNYVAEKFIEKAKEYWEYSDLQIRCIYLISDLAKKGNGVFSIAYSTFKKMFEQRFDLKISLSTVRRFFVLMEKLNLLSINEAKRKNEQQSANIYIIEQQSEEHPIELPSEHQNTSKEVNNKQKPLINTVVNSVDQSTINHEVYIEFKSKGIDKSLFLKVLDEIKNKQGIRNYKAYIRGVLNKVVGHISSRKKVSELSSFYDELIAKEATNPNYNFNNAPWHYDWLNE